MAVIRKLPFGYEIRGGTLAAHQEEAKLVQKIYIQYLSGQSYEMLTQELHRQSIPYLPGKPWNKNMVARILADERYLGSEYYPQLIDEQTYHAVQEKLSTKATIKKKSKTTEAIQHLAVCGVCGAKVLRESYQHGKERWHCPGCNTISTKANDQRIEEGVAKLLEQLRNTPKMVEFGQESREIPLNEIDSKETSFQKLLDTHNFDEALAKSLALDLAATRFNNLSTREYETMRIQNFLENNLTEETTDLTLLHEIADAVLIYPDGQVCLRLKNEQIIGGMI